MGFDQEEAARFTRRIEERAPAALFPLRPNGRPAAKWGGLAPGEKWHNSDPRAGYGIATGVRSGGVVCLDIDAKNGVDGFATLESLESRWGTLPETLQVASPSGGIHLYFWAPAHEIQSNAGVLGPGVDVRGEGGFVRIPGTPHPSLPGGYTVEVDRPPAPLPPMWLRELPRARAPGPPIPDEEILRLAPDGLHELLEETCRGRKGPIWDRWRKILRGERFARAAGSDEGPAIPAEFGGVDDLICRGLFPALAAQGDWYRIAGQDMAALIWPSFAQLARDDEKQGNSTYSLEDLAKKWNSAARWGAELAADREKNRALERRLAEHLNSPPDPPWLVVHESAFYVRTAESPYEYIGPISRPAVWAHARAEWGDIGPDVFKAGQRGPVRASVDDLIELHGRPVTEVAPSLWRTEPVIDGRTLRLPTAPIVTEPEYHGEIARWLDALDPTGAVLDWIAVVTDLRHAAPALWITGAPGVGKSLLAAGLGRIWGGPPTPIHEALGSFNARLLRNPLVDAQEEIPRGRDGRPDTEALKWLISNTSHQINAKYSALRDLEGAVRVILSSNNTNLIRMASDLTGEDAAALAERFVLISVSTDAARAVLPAAERIQREWIDGGAIARHAIWLTQNRTVEPGPRFRMAAPSDRLRTILTTQPGAGFVVCLAIYEAIVQWAKAIIQGQAPPMAPGFAWRDGVLGATAPAVHPRLRQDARRHSMRSVSQTLQRLAHKRVRWGSRSVYSVNLDAIRSWADDEGWGDPGQLDRALALLAEWSRLGGDEAAAKALAKGGTT